MQQLYTVDVNVCKNDRCSNLAVRNAPEYISPSYFLGFPALHCNKCGSNALLLNNNDINTLLYNNINLYLTQIKNHCPHCYSKNQIHYGNTQQKNQRVKCKKCHLVYSYKKITNKQQEKLISLSKLLFSTSDFKQIIAELEISYSHFYRLLKQLDFVCKKNKLLIESHHLINEQLNISTKSKTFFARGNTKPTHLWGITSSLSDSGYILLTSLNYTENKLSFSSLYDSQKPITQKNNRPPILQP